MPVQEDCKQDKLKEKATKVGQKRKQLQGQKGSTCDTFTANRTKIPRLDAACRRSTGEQHAGASDGQERRICSEEARSHFQPNVDLRDMLGTVSLEACAGMLGLEVFWPLEKAVGWRTRGLA